MRRSFPALLSLGMSLARRGILASASIGICVVTVAAIALVGVVLGTRGARAPVHDIPILASSALAWGGGFLLAFAASAHAFRRDRTEGVRDLVLARTRSLRGYLVARVGGLAALVALLVAGGTLVCGLVAMVAAAKVAAVPRTLHATGAAVVFSIAFAAVVAPVAFAALGARSRIGGYVFLLALVTLPEVVVSGMGSAIPEGLAEVLSIPSALAALRSGLAPGTMEIGRALRALVAIGFFIALAIAFVRRDAVRVALEPEERR
ncbi:MAG: hypothetical protein JST00_13115 [Deltaproteobacteria bacterium]|nr:hypothetical protein [Deltaproteobacteria bacterium]